MHVEKVSTKSQHQEVDPKSSKTTTSHKPIMGSKSTGTAVPPDATTQLVEEDISSPTDEIHDNDSCSKLCVTFSAICSVLLVAGTITAALFCCCREAEGRTDSERGLAWHVPTFSYRIEALPLHDEPVAVPCLTGHHKKIDCERYCDVNHPDDRSVQKVCVENCRAVCDDVDPAKFSPMYWPAIPEELLQKIGEKVLSAEEMATLKANGTIEVPSSDRGHKKRTSFALRVEEVQSVDGFKQEFKKLGGDFEDMYKELKKRWWANVEQSGQFEKKARVAFPAKWSLVHQDHSANSVSTPKGKPFDVLDPKTVFSQQDDYLNNPQHRASIPGLNESFLFDDWKNYLGIQKIKSQNFQLVGAGVGPPGAGKSKFFDAVNGKFTSPDGKKILLAGKDFVKMDNDEGRLHFLPFIDATNGHLFVKLNEAVLTELGFETRPFVWVHPMSMRKFIGAQIRMPSRMAEDEEERWVYAVYPNVAANGRTLHTNLALSVARRLLLNGVSIVWDGQAVRDECAPQVVMAELQAKRVKLQQQQRGEPTIFSFQFHGVFMTDMDKEWQLVQIRAAHQGRAVSKESCLEKGWEQLVHGVDVVDGGKVDLDKRMQNFVPATAKKVYEFFTRQSFEGVEPGNLVSGQKTKDGFQVSWSVSTNDGDKNAPLQPLQVV